MEKERWKNALDIFLLIVVGNLNISTTWLQVYCVLLSKHFILDREMLKDDIVNVVVTVIW